MLLQYTQNVEGNFFKIYLNHHDYPDYIKALANTKNIGIKTENQIKFYSAITVFQNILPKVIRIIACVVKRQDL